MQDARTANQKTDTRFAREVAICRGSVGTSLFVSKTNEANTQVDGFFGNHSHRMSDKAEYHGYAKPMESRRNDLGAGRFRHLDWKRVQLN